MEDYIINPEFRPNCRTCKDHDQYQTAAHWPEATYPMKKETCKQEIASSLCSSQ